MPEAWQSKCLQMLLNVPWMAKPPPVKTTAVESSFLALSNHAPLSPTLLHPEITYFLISASMFLPVLELHINESTWYVLFCVWHLLFNIMSMKFTFITVHIGSITSIRYGLSVLPLINIWVVSCLLWTKQLWTFLYMSLCKHMFFSLLDKYPSRVVGEC